MAEQPQDNLLREIDEELRQEQYAKLWKKYGTYIIAVAAVIVLSVAGYQGWRTYDTSSRMEYGERFAAAQKLAATEKNDEARQAFAELATDANAGYSLLARFQEAALETRQGDTGGAGVGFRALADDDGLPAVYRDLALIIEALNSLDSADPADLKRRLAPLAADDNPWRHLALELTATLDFRTGQVDEARKTLTRLSEDATTPQGVRLRASEVLAALGK